MNALAAVLLLLFLGACTSFRHVAYGDPKEPAARHRAVTPWDFEAKLRDLDIRARKEFARESTQFLFEAVLCVRRALMLQIDALYGGLQRPPVERDDALSRGGSRCGGPPPRFKGGTWGDSSRLLSSEVRPLPLFPDYNTWRREVSAKKKCGRCWATTRGPEDLVRHSRLHHAGAPLHLPAAAEKVL